MLEAKDIVNKAIKYLFELYSNTGFNINNILLEEIFISEYANKPDCWHVTLGFNESQTKAKSLSEALMGSNYDLITKIDNEKKRGIRKYKTLIYSSEGDFIAMIIRELENA
jgi:hypothetical protein